MRQVQVGAGALVAKTQRAEECGRIRVRVIAPAGFLEMIRQQVVAPRAIVAAALDRAFVASERAGRDIGVQARIGEAILAAYLDRSAERVQAEDRICAGEH
jgi:hypothetical protein